MSDLPNQGTQEKMVPMSDVQHLVAREVAAHQMREMKENVGNLTNDVKSSFAELRATLQAMSKATEAQHSNMYNHMDDCRDGLRREIDKDFPSMIQFKVLEANVGNLATRDEVTTLRTDIKILAGKFSIVLLVGMAVINILLKKWGII